MLRFDTFNFRRTTMNPDILKGEWNRISGDAKKQWGKLTDNDLLQIKGDAQKLIGTLQKIYGYKKDEAEKEVENFVKRHQKNR